MHETLVTLRALVRRSLGDDNLHSPCLLLPATLAVTEAPSGTRDWHSRWAFRGCYCTQAVPPLCAPRTKSAPNTDQMRLMHLSPLETMRGRVVVAAAMVTSGLRAAPAQSGQSTPRSPIDSTSGRAPRARLYIIARGSHSTISTTRRRRNSFLSCDANDSVSTALCVAGCRHRLSPMTIVTRDGHRDGRLSATEFCHVTEPLPFAVLLRLEKKKERIEKFSCSWVFFGRW